MKDEHILTLVGWFAFVMTLFLGTIAFYTFDGSPPFEISDSVSSVTREENGNYVLTESRGFVGQDNQVLTIFRTLYKKEDDKHVNSIEGGSVMNQNDDYVVLRAIQIPPHLNGWWCSRAIVFWRPSLSLKQHSLNLPDLCFEIPRK